MTWDRSQIDEAYASFAGNITAFSDVLGVIEDENNIQRFSVEKFHIETPIELDLRQNENEEITLGSAPPIYRTQTTILPVFHTLRMTIVATRKR